MRPTPLLPLVALAMACAEPAVPVPRVVAPTAVPARAAPLPPEVIEAAPVPAGRARHAVVLVVDTLRADVLERADAPNIDAVAAQGLFVERAWSTSTWTVPAVVSLFTGSFLRTHGWDLPTGDMAQRPALPAMPTLAEVLRGAGFGTEGLYSNGYLAAELGFSRGFEEWRRSADARMPQEVAKRVAAWERDGRRHFLYVHLLGVHSGLKPSVEAQRRHGLDPAWSSERVGFLIDRAKRDEPGAREAYRVAYLAVVEDLDRLVGEILAALDPVRAETAVILLSDHGEELGETGVFGHGWSVAESLTHVPLIAAGPGVPRGRRATGSLAEVTDLVTDALGVDHPWPVQSPYAGPLVAERHGKRAVLAAGRWKGAWNGGERQVHDLLADPAGIASATGGEAEVEAALRAWQAATPRGEPRTGSVELDPKTVEALRELGYVE